MRGKIEWGRLEKVSSFISQKITITLNFNIKLTKENYFINS